MPHSRTCLSLLLLVSLSLGCKGVLDRLRPSADAGAEPPALVADDAGAAALSAAAVDGSTPLDDAGRKDVMCDSGQVLLWGPTQNFCARPCAPGDKPCPGKEECTGSAPRFVEKMQGPSQAYCVAPGTRLDGGPMSLDAGLRLPDAGFLFPDAGVRLPDAGLFSFDAGSLLKDAGLSKLVPLVLPLRPDGSCPSGYARNVAFCSKTCQSASDCPSASKCKSLAGGPSVCSPI